MEKRITNLLTIIIPFSLMLLASCNRNVVYSDSSVIKGNKWNLMNVLTFRVPVTDTLSSNNVSFTIRTGSAYPFRNIYLFVTAVSPDGKNVTDTLQYYLADEKGKWLGRGFGDIKELGLPFKSNVYFPRKGIYEFRVRHGMRTEDLKGVYDLGLRIEKINK